MTPLGLTRPQCRATLLRYGVRLRALAAAIHSQPAVVALTAQDELAFELEVDVRARAAAEARARMSRVERVVLTPALRRLWTRLPRYGRDLSISAAAPLLALADELERLAATLG